MVPPNWGILRRLTKWDLWKAIGILILIIYSVFYVYNALFNSAGYSNRN